MDQRELKAMQIAATMPVRRDAKGWIVPSQSGPGTYRVAPPSSIAHIDALSGLGCTCPDFELRQRACKHVLAVQFVMRRETVALDGSVLTQEVAVTYTQQWSAYNTAQTREKELFLPMLADLCGTLSRPYSGRGRPALPISDMAYTVITKTYSGLSARRFDTDVREAKERGLTDTDPSFNTVLRTMRDPNLTPALEGLVKLSALPLVGVETDFATDSTGFSTCRYVRWYDHKWGKEMRKQEWVKLHAMTGVLTNIVTAAQVTDWRVNDTVRFRPLLAETAANFRIHEVSGDKAYSSKANLQAVDDAGGTPFIPFKALQSEGAFGTPAITTADIPALPTLASAWTKMYHLFCYQRDTFLAHYHRRSNVECTFSMIKRKFGDALRSKSDTGQVNEVLCKVICHNLCVLISAIYELGLPEPTFCTDQRPVTAAVAG